MPVHEFSIRNRGDFTLAEELLRFPYLCIGLKDSGRWTIYWHRTCRFLSLPEGKCHVHNTPQQSLICRQYNPYRCWYRKAFAGDITLQMIMFDAERLHALASQLAWDAQGELESVPTWEEMSDFFSGSYPFRAAGGEGRSSCHRLLVHPGRITRRIDLELVRFRLGFPGVTLAISDSGWAFCLSGDPPDTPMATNTEGDEAGRYFDPFGLIPDRKSMRHIDYAGLPEFVDSCIFDGDRFVGTISPAAIGRREDSAVETRAAFVL